MFDITQAQQVFYGDDQFVVIFRDRQEKDTYYLVPVPRLRSQNGQPVFSLTRYKTNDGGVSGVCTFEVELYSPGEARAAAERQLGRPVTWGQFTWTGGDTFFSFDLDGESRLATVTPSLFASNVAAFQVELGTEGDVQSFVNAFSGDGRLSPFRIEYDMRALTQLLGASALVKYDATAAIEFEKKYEKRRDTWGNEKSVLVGVKQLLWQSGAGKVEVTEGAGGSKELVQRVTDWAKTTLETQVAQTVESARQMATGPNPVSATTSFQQTYSQDTVVEWSTPVSANLPKFDDDTWRKVYTEVDNRELVVTFALEGDLLGAEGKVLFESVEVTVDYPTRQTKNTFVLIPADPSRTTLTYVAPGARQEGRFDPRFQYKYKVNYPGGALPYTSGWMSSEDTFVGLRPNLFGIRQVAFVGANVPFAAGTHPAKDRTVSKVFVDFFFQPPPGQTAAVMTREMTANGTDGTVSFDSVYHLPLTNTYSYRLRYLMANGTVVTTQGPPAFGSANVDLVQVFSPLDALVTFSLRALNATEQSGFELIEVNAAYYDPKNSQQQPEARHDWAWQPEKTKGLKTGEPWTFQALPSPQTAYFELSGQLIYGDGDDFTLDRFTQPTERRSLILSSDEYPYSVKIDTTHIDWDLVATIYINFAQLRNVTPPGAAMSDVPPPFFLKPFGLLSPAEVRAVEGERENVLRFDLLDPAGTEQRSLPLYYNIRQKRTSGNTTFLFSAEYVLKDGTSKYVDEEEVKNKLQLVLPPVGTSDKPKVNRRVVDLKHR
ncbi:hypothetical protein [Pyxidicoccus caerfyrddinensis]|uniref:hypothetical protein n=1 Tax=Pyxidicoccus caerfyrddinensis TaxID=2709663 RepID=UPI0013DA9A40|nr:hypothetical protein [Pyxidicoccus caerfyrddinensis]